MSLEPRDLDFLQDHHTAAMVTIGDDGRPKIARVAVALVDGKLWSSGTTARVRTERLRRDPRCTLYVHDAAAAWLAFETTVTILDGPDVPRHSLELFRVMQRRPKGPVTWYGGELDEAQFQQAMVDEGRVIYEFAVERSYGLV
jgi:PPOX class probable F420-dependent enzyme